MTRFWEQRRSAPLGRWLAVDGRLRQVGGVSDVSLGDAALVLLGHGTELNDQSAAPVFQHAAELRRRHVFQEVREAFWKQEPQINRVLAEIQAPRVFIVPLFISEGYFAGQVIPEALGFDASRVVRQGARTMFYCQPVGLHPGMTNVILSRAAEVARQFPFPRAPKPAETTLFIAGHGTPKNSQSRQTVERQAEIIRAGNTYAAVHAVFLEEEPRIADCPLLAQTRNCVLVPFFISDGLHVVEDIPVLLGEPAQVVKARLAAGQPGWRNPTETHGKRFWCSPPVGTEPRLAEVILELVREGAAKEG